MKRLLVAFALIAFIFISFFVYGQFLNRQKDVAAQGEEETPVIAVADKISAEAQIVPHYFTTLSSIVGGQVSILLVEEGEAVRAGDPLLRLEAPAIENALRQVETAVPVAFQI